jgi:predicted nucleic acid binding AN1-type Zn finger protein
MEKFMNYIKDLENDFRKKIQNNPNTIAMADKTEFIVKKIDQIVQNRCPKELADVRDLCTFSTNNGKVDLILKPGKEKEGEEAIQKLNNCQGNLSMFYVGMESLAALAINVINNQLDLCVKDCANLATEDEARACMKGCFDNTYKYTVQVFQKISLNQAEQVESQLKKI